MGLRTVRVLLCGAMLASLAPEVWGQSSGGPFRNLVQAAGRRVAASEQSAMAELAARFEPEPAPAPVSEPREMFQQPSAAENVVPWGEAETAQGDSGSCETCASCGGTCGDTYCTSACRPRLWFGSIDYLLFRPRMSQAVAAVQSVSTTNTSTTPAIDTTTDTVDQFPFRYQSAFRVAGGVRFLDCGGDFQVAYWRLTNDAHYYAGPADPTNNNPTILANLGNNPGDGQYLNAQSGIVANIIDVEFGKSISMGGVCGACGGCGCPRWDLRFLVGARVGDITRFNDSIVVDDSGAQSFGDINARFVGAGPRMGIQGRRYLGTRGRWSLYSKAAGSILIGDYRMGRSLTVPGTVEDATVVTSQNELFSRTIPTADIEVGGTWQMTPYTFISVGYFYQCWWDLGQGETVSGSSFGALDTSNILGFDGLLVRAELQY